MGVKPAVYSENCGSSRTKYQRASDTQLVLSYQISCKPLVGLVQPAIHDIFVANA